MVLNFLTFFLSVILSLISYRYLIPFFGKYKLDVPNKRSSHFLPTPTSGGLIFVVFSVFYGLIARQYIFILCMPLAIIGFIDDRLNLSSWFRFLSQTITSILIIRNSNILFNFEYSFFIESLLIITLVIFICAVINFSNFIDGIDGLLSTCILIVFVTLAFESSINLWVLNGSILGFIFWNKFPAKIFMGDIGSTFLGAIYAFLVITSPNFQVAIAKIMIGSPIFIDTISCLFIRLKNKQNIFDAHKMHFYQRLSQNGWGHSRIVLLYSSVILINSCLFIFANIYLLLSFSLIQLIVGLCISKKFVSDKGYVISDY